MAAHVDGIATGVSSVASSCEALATSVEQYATQVEKTQQAIRDLCDRLGSIGGIVGTFFEFVRGHGLDEVHEIADEIRTVIAYFGSEADATVQLLESAKQSVNSWVLDLEKSANKHFVEFFGEPEFQTQNPAKFLAFNLPYVLVPLLLLIRMRKPLPFTRKF